LLLVVSVLLNRL